MSLRRRRVTEEEESCGDFSEVSSREREMESDGRGVREGEHVR